MEIKIILLSFFTDCIKIILTQFLKAFDINSDLIMSIFFLKKSFFSSSSFFAFKLYYCLVMAESK